MDEIDKKTVILNLSLLKNVWGMTNEQIGEVLGVTGAVWTNFVRGKNYPQLQTWVRVERATGVAILRWLTENLTVADLPPAPLAARAAEKPVLSLFERVEALENSLKILLEK